MIHTVRCATRLVSASPVHQVDLRRVAPASRSIAMTATHAHSLAARSLNLLPTHPPRPLTCEQPVGCVAHLPPPRQHGARLQLHQPQPLQAVVPHEHVPPGRAVPGGQRQPPAQLAQVPGGRGGWGPRGPGGRIGTSAHEEAQQRAGRRFTCTNGGRKCHGIPTAGATGRGGHIADPVGTARPAPCNPPCPGPRQRSRPAAGVLLWGSPVSIGSARPGYISTCSCVTGAFSPSHPPIPPPV